MAERVRVAAADVREYGRQIVEVGGRRVGVFAAGERFVAYEDRCLHLGGPVCSEGELQACSDGGTVVCPLHRWRYDLATGELLADRSRRLSPVCVEVDGPDLMISL